MGLFWIIALYLMDLGISGVHSEPNLLDVIKEDNRLEEVSFIDNFV